MRKVLGEKSDALPGNTNPEYSHHEITEMHVNMLAEP